MRKKGCKKSCKNTQQLNRKEHFLPMHTETLNSKMITMHYVSDYIIMTNNNTTIKVVDTFMNNFLASIYSVSSKN